MATIRVAIEIPVERIAALMSSAIEGNDPVTTASRGGWCSGINNKSRKAYSGDWWWADPKYFEGQFSIEVVEVDDETTGHETRHRIGPKDVQRGLAVMAEKFPNAFSQVLADETDAPCADTFLQCIVFGQDKYA